MSRNSKTSAAQQLKFVMECRKAAKPMHSGASKTEFVQLRFTTGYPDSAPSRHIPESNWNELELPVQHQDVVLLDVGRE